MAWPSTTFTRAILPKVAPLQIPHDVHFTKEGSQLRGERVAASIESQLSGSK